MKSNNKVKVLNNRAFTLTELIAVIVVLSLVITATVAIFVNVRKNVLKKEYDNLVVYLETRAVEFANKTSVTTISVEDLIEEGFIKPDDETDIYDPRDNSSMNCYILKMEYKNGEYIAKLSSNLGQTEGKCNKYNRTTLYDICKVINNKCVSINSNWINDNITLGVAYNNELLVGDNIEYNWSTNTGFTSNENMVTTNVELVGNINYKCEVSRKDADGKDANGVATKNIQIDKESPVINELKMDTNWSVSKNIDVLASDGMGSGIGGYAIAKVNSECTNYAGDKNLKVNENGTYKVCVKDKVGNVSVEKTIEVDKIDKEAPSIVAKNAENEIIVGTDNEVASTYFTVTYPAKSGGTVTCNYKRTGNLAIGDYTLECTVVGGNGLTATASTKLSVIPDIPAAPVLTTKLENANGADYNGTWTSKSIYISITPGRSVDLIERYEYSLDNKTWTKPNNLSLNGNQGNFVYSSEIDGIIYVRGCNEKGCGEASAGKTLRIDKISPVIKAKNSSNNVQIEILQDTSSFFTVTYSKSGGSVSCNPADTSGLALGTYTVSCIATGGNGLTASASTTLKIVPQIPSAPTIITKYENANGNDYNGTWTNKSIYIGITAGTTKDVVSKYQYKIGNGAWTNISSLTMSENNGSFIYTSEINNTIYVRACNDNNCGEASAGKTLKIDKTAPTCKLSVTRSQVSFSNKSSDVSSYGISKTTTASYGSSTASMSTGTFYGHVVDAAGNTGRCSASIEYTSSYEEPYSYSYDCGSYEESCRYVCYRYMTSTEKKNGKCSGAATEGAYDTCWKWKNSSSCTSDFPYLDTSGTDCSGSSYVSKTCYDTGYETVYYCSGGYTKLNNSYCYKLS